MSFTLFFPSQGTDGAYKDLVEEHEVYEAVIEEVKKAINDMGSDGYDLDLPPFPWTGPSGERYESQEELEQGSDSDQTEWVMLGHGRGIEKAARLWAPQIFNDLWIRYRAGEGDVAVDDTTYAKLPDGVMIALKEETNDDSYV